MSPIDVLSSFLNALIGGVAVIALIRLDRMVTRMRRRRWFANHQFMRSYMTDIRSTIKPLSRLVRQRPFGV